jgi:hypothetical protein
MECNKLAHDRVQWRAPMNTEMYIRTPENGENFLIISMAINF